MILSEKEKSKKLVEKYSKIFPKVISPTKMKDGVIKIVFLGECPKCKKETSFIGKARYNQIKWVCIKCNYKKIMKGKAFEKYLEDNK